MWVHLRYAYLPNAGTLLYKIKKKFTNITIDQIRNIFNYWEAVKLTMTETSILKF